LHPSNQVVSSPTAPHHKPGCKKTHFRRIQSIYLLMRKLRPIRQSSLYEGIFVTEVDKEIAS